MPSTTPPPSSSVDIENSAAVIKAFNLLAAAAEEYRGTRREHADLDAASRLLKLVVQSHLERLAPPPDKEKKG